MNEKMDVLFGAYIAITDGKISYIGKTAPEEKPATIVDGTGMVAMPGLVNCHTHLASTVLRSYVDDASHTEALTQQLQKWRIAWTGPVCLLLSCFPATEC